MRTILHVDLDAFYAAVEQRDDPSLRGKPVLVGGSARRGVVASCSYEARKFGIHSAMPMAEALRRCPRAIVVRHRMERYAEASATFFAILGDYSPDVEGLSLDEAFLDVTASERLLGDGPTIARAIKQRVRDELALVASVGVAPIKLAAKIASDIDKPDGLRVVTDVLAFLHPLPMTRLWGVGEATRAALASMGLSTVGDVARYPEAALVARLGAVTGHHLAALARGEDPRPVIAEHEQVSIGHQETFDDDIDDKGELAVVLLDQADRVAHRLRESHLRARAVVLIVKYDDFRQITRRTTLAAATSDGGVLARTAIELLAKVPIESPGSAGARSDADASRRSIESPGSAGARSDADASRRSIESRKGGRVRLCGISATNLEPRDAPRQLGLLDEATREKGERLGDTLDKLAARFGKPVIRRAVHVKNDHDE